jgi:hypothetical protein
MLKPNFLKMKGDYYRYISGHVDTDKKEICRKASLTAYQQAMDNSIHLPPLDPKVLSGALSLAPLYMKLMTIVKQLVQLLRVL